MNEKYTHEREGVAALTLYTQKGVQMYKGCRSAKTKRTETPCFLAFISHLPTVKSIEEILIRTKVVLSDYRIDFEVLRKEGWPVDAILRKMNEGQPISIPVSFEINENAFSAVKLLELYDDVVHRAYIAAMFGVMSRKACNEEILIKTEKTMRQLFRLVLDDIPERVS